MDQKNDTARASHWGAALAAGIATGLAAGLFLRSQKGQELTEDAKKTALKLQKQIQRRMEDVKDMTRETYDTIVEEIVSHYAETKDIAASELERLRTYLFDQWDDLQSNLK